MEDNDEDLDENEKAELFIINDSFKMKDDTEDHDSFFYNSS